MQFFNTISYTIGGYTFALNEIENGVLRSNRKAIGAVTKPFSKSDPRLKVALPAPEPKIHFALVCGAKSCPPIKTYTSAVRTFITFSYLFARLLIEKLLIRVDRSPYLLKSTQTTLQRVEG